MESSWGIAVRELFPSGRDEMMPSTTRHLVASLQALRFKNSFNPYTDQCPVYDVTGAPQLRLQCLAGILEAAHKNGVHSVWIGRDLGHRGGRRTGLALTDDISYGEHAARWGVASNPVTKGEAVSERTASVIWGLLRRISQRVFLWNVFPLHPHLPGEPFSNRMHSANERVAGESVLSELIRLLNPAIVVAVGKDAQRSAIRVAADRTVLAVRHPSYGGQSEFVEQVSRIYDLAQPVQGRLV